MAASAWTQQLSEACKGKNEGCTVSEFCKSVVPTVKHHDWQREGNDIYSGVDNIAVSIKAAAYSV